MSELAATLGIPAPFEFEGKTYSVSIVNVEIAGAFETWLEGRALDAIRRHAPDPTSPERQGAGKLLPGEWAAAHEVWQANCAAGTYEFEGPLATSARYSTVGRKYLAFLQLQFASKGVTLALLDRVWKDREALERLQAAQQQVAGPNAGRPVAESPTGQTPPGSSGAAEEAPPASASS